MQTINIIPNQSGYFMYSLTDFNGVIQYVGYDTFKGVMALEKLSGHLTPVSYRLSFTGPYERQIDASNAASDYIRQHCQQTPPLNLAATSKRGQQVQCDQTGIVYRNALDCAQQLAIGQGTLSNHLRRKPGHKSIRGMTFSYVKPGINKPAYDMHELINLMGTTDRTPEQEARHDQLRALAGF